MPAPVKKSTQEKYTHIITDFLKQNSLISVNALEKAINAPQSTIAKSILNESVLIPEKHIFNILRVLSYYGIKIDGYTIEYEEDIEKLIKEATEL